jgi:hypothetical protein
MRRTEHQRKVDAAEAELEAMIQVIALEELNRLFRGVQLKLRRINQYRPKAHPNHTRLTKADVTGTSLWDLFKGRLLSRLMEALLGGSISLYSLLTMRVAEQPLELDTDAIARELEYQVGERITQVTNTIKREVGRRIVAWYNSPGVTMQTIINQLRPAFGINRAALIAATETTNLHSLVQTEIMTRLGYDEWWWETKRDNLVCVRPMKGPDGQTYNGCRALHGKRFKLGQPMPPDGSHVSCRCASHVVIPTVTRPIETPIIDTSHLVKAEFVEGEHPRDKGGEFTSKGGEGAGGKMEKPVKVNRTNPKTDAFKQRFYSNAIKGMNDYVASQASDPDEKIIAAYDKANQEPDKEKAYNDLVALNTERIKDAAGDADWLVTEFNELLDNYKTEYSRGVKRLDITHEAKPLGDIDKLPPLSHWKDALIDEATTPLYLPPKEYKEMAIASPKREAESISKQYNIPVDKVIEKSKEYLTKTLSDKSISLRLPIEALDNIIKSGGRIKTQFETEESKGTFSPAKRNTAERQGLGYPDGISDNKTLRPVYGYISGAGTEADTYGEIELVFKESVKNRTTVTCGDSLGGFLTSSLCGTPMLSPDIEGMDGQVEKLYKGNFAKSNLYMEAQIQGGAHISETATVKFHRQCFSADGIILPEYYDVESKLLDMGIRVEYDNKIY